MNFHRTKVSFFITFCLVFTLSAQEYNIFSPNTNIEVNLKITNKSCLRVNYKGKKIIDEICIDVKTSDERNFGSNTKIVGTNSITVNENIKLDIPNKDRVIESEFNQLTVKFDVENELIIRVFNDGLAYRFVDNNPESKNIIDEKMDLFFNDNTLTYFPWEESMYTHNERLYNLTKVSSLKQGDFCSLPVMFKLNDVKVLFSESSLYNYPGMFLEKKSENTLSAKFPKYVLETKPAIFDPTIGDQIQIGAEDESDRTQKIVKEANYIAKVEGSKKLPWRVFIIGDDDRIFVESNLITQLSESSRLEDTSWIKPGKVAWDWWNANNIYGVDFKAGINQETYKYYIDFASENNIEYILLDEGWTKSTTQIYEVNPNIQIEALIEYASSKNVGVFLWVLWKPLDKDIEGLLKLYSSWGAAGVKVDFMKRNDQYMIKSYEKIAEIAAKYKILVNFHGAFKPSGIERRWPNVLSYEGVMGNEQNKWKVSNFPFSDNIYPVDPEHNLTIPFIRMAAGPMDYTPGAMTNVNRFDYKWSPADVSPPGFNALGQPLNTADNMHAINTRPMVTGTRAHQVAMYTVFESPLQMMCDSPTVYKKEQETVDFITQIPTVWDETVVLEAAVADYIVLARRNGENWYLAAMTDWEPRDFNINLSFLDKNTDYSVQIYKDGINANRNAMDYKLDHKTMSSITSLKIQMSSGGGFSAIFMKN
jgi:alpha-glucosidase